MLKRSFFLNLIVIAALFAAILFAFFTSLKAITKHGQDAIVPSVTGKNLKQVSTQLEGFELEVDSIYLPYKDPLEIIYQEPAAGNRVKKGRTLFITVNKITPPSIVMPDLVNMSFRNAVLTLKSFRLEMGDTIFKPDIAAGAVLQVLQKGLNVRAGQNVAIGSRIDLVVGAGLSDSTMMVPNLIGTSYAFTKSTLDGLGVLYNIVWEGSINDSNAAIIYKQFPEAKNELDFDNVITPGDMVDLYIMQKPSAELLRMNQPGVAKLIDPNDTNSRITYGPPTTELPYEQDTNAVVVKKKPKPKPQSTEQEIKDVLGDKKDAPLENNEAQNEVPKPAELQQRKTPIKKEIVKEEKAPIKETSLKNNNTKQPTKEKTLDSRLVDKKKEEKKPAEKKKDAPVKNINKNSAENDYN